MLLTPRFYIREGFFDEDTCHRIRRAMDAGAREPAEILDAATITDTSVRRADLIEVDAATLLDVEQRLDAVRDEVAAHFRVRLGPREGTGFLRYPTGGFYLPHVDRGTLADWPDAARRRIAVVLFLNSADTPTADGGFHGGILRLHRPGHPNSPLDIHPLAGRLVAFDADVLHEVRPVESGTRDTVVDWFYGN